MNNYQSSIKPDRQKFFSELAKNIYVSLSKLFPVSCSSDEFWFFPQYVYDISMLCKWDNFSEETVMDCCQKLSIWDSEIKKLYDINSPSNDSELDAYLLSNMVRTLQEHLEFFRPWERQPTFHLTIACIGIAQALSYGKKDFIRQRALSLPNFLKTTSHSLKNVPGLFMSLGLNMIKDTRLFFKDCLPKLPELKEALNALDDLEQKMIQMPVIENFLFSQSSYAHLVDSHMQTQLDLKSISDMINYEVNQSTEFIIDYNKKTHKASNFQYLLAQKDYFKPEKKSELEWFSDEVKAIKRHCVKNGFINDEINKNCQVQIHRVPDYLKTIRTASSYSFSPFQKLCKGTFFVLENETTSNIGGSVQLSIESPMLVAHETYPGHHLLDSYRANLSNWVRRPLESPLFYEGWACFAEDLMLKTNYYHTSEAAYLVLKRRLWRAVRGFIDLNLNTGKITLKEAAKKLHQLGIEKHRAYQIVRQYPLNPGYQLCYTIGLLNFFELKSSSDKTLKKWIQDILSVGEIPFSIIKKLF